jgi:hypothetical protein
MTEKNFELTDEMLAEIAGGVTSTTEEEQIAVLYNMKDIVTRLASKYGRARVYDAMHDPEVEAMIRRDDFYELTTNGVWEKAIEDKILAMP